ncbi:hypothetical protein Tco_1057116 [Tanacetum coccineum]|uniref:Uncharacterized protein n=1 Tax=Tanacetum coccineum TaxID=301880 RepID=A0ABQ5H596_9ASTR
MHKEAQQAVGGPTSLGATSEERAHPQLSSADEISKKIKLEDLSDLLKDTRSAFFTPDSPQDEPIIVSDESEEEVDKDKDTLATSQDVPEYTSIPHPPSPKSAQIQELIAQVYLLQSQINELEQQKAKAKAEVASLKARPLYPDINQLTDLLVFELKNIQWELPVEFQALPSQVSSVQEKLKTLDSLPSLLNKVTDTLNRFATAVENASGAIRNNVPSASHATASPAEGEKNTTKDVETNLQNEFVDLLGIDMVEQYHNKKLLFDKYCDKMLKRRNSSKIINCDVLIQKSPISLKVYREDGTIKVIANFKVSDLHLAEWREVVQTCPDRKEKGWKTIYRLINTRMEYLDQTEKELKIDFNKPLKEQDPLNELNELANKKRKRTSDLKDHSMSTKKHNFNSLGSLKIGKYLQFSLCSGTETEEGLWKELQFSLVDNSKLNVVYLLNRKLKRLFHF